MLRLPFLLGNDIPALPLQEYLLSPLQEGAKKIDCLTTTNLFLTLII